MTSSPTDVSNPLAKGVTVTADALVVELLDGRALTVPLAWYPRLFHATAEERADWQLIGGGEGIHWSRVDEDVSVEGLLAGRRSHESTPSLARWLATRPGVPA